MSIIKSHISAMSAYEPPLEGRDSSSQLLLDFNERTMPVSEKVQSALIEYIKSGSMQAYPKYGDVEKRIADYAGVLGNQLMITNGSDQGIDLIFRAVSVPGAECIIPSPSFAMYQQCAGIENLKVISPPYSLEKGFPTLALIEAISDSTKIICIANPNNPTGTIVNRDDIVTILKAAPNSAVLIDECYFEYSGVSVVDLVGQYDNLFVTRTFSKTWGIPSLRLGYLISDEKNIKALKNIRGPYDINQMAVVGITAALDEPESMSDYVTEVMEESKPLLEGFLDKNNIEYWPSQANFIWLFPENAELVEEKLREENILVRPKKGADGKLGLRATLGTVVQTQRLIEVMRQCLASQE